MFPLLLHGIYHLAYSRIGLVCVCVGGGGGGGVD